MSISFLLVGSGCLAFCLGKPALDAYRARSWVETPCEILGARIDPIRSGGKTGGRIDAGYRYHWKGEWHSSNRYDFFSVYSNDVNLVGYVQELGDSSSAKVCYVNPGDPDEAVLKRTLPDKCIFIGLSSFPFAIIGAGGLWLALRETRLARKRVA